ncbi:MAG: hypothetical protein Q9226_001523 [Calogaya cf. arnoldii]
MLRKIGIRASLKDPQSSEQSDTDNDDCARRPQNALRALSEPSNVLLDKLPERTGYGNHQRKTSNAGSSYPGEEATDLSITNTLDTTTFDQLGLHLVHYSQDAVCDIIFVHGLGGSAMRTWSWKRDTAQFWPAWLSDDEQLYKMRVFTFGYNSNFRGSATNLNITDFAKDLLFHLLTFSQGDFKPIGGRPIIFVAHSMGGLVVKKAHIIGKHDPEFSGIMAQVYGMVFLATPHRGSQYAKVLNNILSTAPMGAPPKAYVASLDAQSEALQDINEQFRKICQDLVLVSFWETTTVSFGLTKAHIVEKESATLGYPQETSSGLNADHHTICKFQNRGDHNYVIVRNTLRLWVARLKARDAAARPLVLGINPIEMAPSVSQVTAILGFREAAEDELKVHRSHVLEGTCQWITRRQDLRAWIEGLSNPQASNVFWLVGLPATGKTVLSSVVIDHLQFLGKSCQYNFFSSGHQSKRTAAYCLRSIATQLAIADEDFRLRLSAFHDETGVTFNTQNQAFKVVWEKIFEGIIFKMRFQQPLYWVLDAVDEADQYSLLVSHLTKMQPISPIGVFFASRPVKIPPLQYRDAPPLTLFLAENDTLDDIHTYIQRSVESVLPDNQEIQTDVTQQILEKASGSFLWVRLALETLEHNWHTEDDIRRALTELPQGMESLYSRMLDKIQDQSPRLRAMAERILTWVACSWRPLSISELAIALEPDFTGFIRLEETVVEICGHFVAVHNSRVFIIHMTARDFLLKKGIEKSPFINSREAHTHIAETCLRYLSSDEWRRVFKHFQHPSDISHMDGKQNRLLLAEEGRPFLGYATCYWAFHLSKAHLSSQRLNDTLQGFLNGYCLSWIEAIALSQNLRYLTRSAQYLKTYVKRMSRAKGSGPFDSPVSLTFFPEQLAGVIRSWANDFVRVVGKFGSNLVQCPSSIHTLIPPFCPRGSMIGETFVTHRERALTVSGLPYDGWNDCLASVSVEDDLTASKVLAADRYLLVLAGSEGSVSVWYANTCESARVIQHQEYVNHMVLDDSQTLVATAGTQTYRIWDISTGEELHRLQRTGQALTTAIAFGTKVSEFLVGRDDCSITTYDLNTTALLSTFRPRNPKTILQNCPKTMVLSPDRSKVAMAWRGKPPLVWDTSADPAQQPQQCRTMKSTDALCAPETLQWLPDGDSLLVLCQNTLLVEWCLYDEEQIEHGHIQPREMAISQDGNFLLTSDHAGTMSVWMFPRLSLVFRLVNENEYIRALTFSPDGQRFYDIRGGVCNVWEPDALIRADEESLEDQSSVGDLSLATEPVIRSDESSQCQVTALASDSDDRYFCVGRDDGTVLIQEALDGKRVRKVYGHSSTSAVINLLWSASGRYMVSGDDSGRIITKRLEVKGEAKWAVYAVLDVRLPESVQQFLFSHDEKLLLISTATSDYVWNMKTKEKISSRRWGSRQSRRWIAHPQKPSLLIWIDPNEVHTYTWSTLEHSDSPQTPSEIPQLLTPGHSSSNKIVQWIALTENKKYIVFETLPSTGHTSTRSSSGLHLEVLSTSDLRRQHPHTISSDCMADLAGRVKRLIGTYQDTIVFLDYDYWVCTWRIESVVLDVKRHFFLPRDWLNNGNLQLAVLNRQGTFFCPKYGDVAIVRGGLRF